MPLRLREGEREKESGERRCELPCARALVKNTNTGGMGLQSHIVNADKKLLSS